MTHIEIHYNAADQSAADSAAIRDIIDYLGQEKFDYLTTQFRALGPETLTLDQLHYWLMLPGISGYPVSAWHRYTFPAVETA